MENGQLVFKPWLFAEIWVSQNPGFVHGFSKDFPPHFPPHGFSGRPRERPTKNKIGRLWVPQRMPTGSWAPWGPKERPKEREPKKGNQRKGTIFIDGPSMNSLMVHQWIHWRMSINEYHWWMSINEYQWISSSLKSSSLKKQWKTMKKLWKTMKNHETQCENNEKM